MRSLLFVVALICAPSLARAQACDDGRVRVSGHCCWPGQSWSREDRVCDGVPQCPARTSEEGETCVARATAPVAPVAPVAPGAPVTPIIRPVTPASGPPMIHPIGAAPPVVEGTSATSVASWPTLPGGRPNGVVDPVVRRGTDDGLVFGGLITFGVGYVVGLLMGVGDESASNCYTSYFSGARTGCGTWPVALVPIVGGALSSSLSIQHGRANGVALGLGLGVPMGVAQLVGLWIFLHGIAGYTLDIDEARADLGGGASMRLAFDAPGADVGLSAVIDF